MTNESDQATAKVHNFTIEFADDMIQTIVKTGADFKMSKTIIFDIAILRLKEEFDEVDWKNPVKFNHFIEKLLSDAFEIQKKHVKIKMRNLPSK